MIKTILTRIVLLIGLLLGNSIQGFGAEIKHEDPNAQTGSFERMIVTNGTVAIDLDRDSLASTGLGSEKSKQENLRFEIGRNSFFTIRVFNHVLRGPETGSMQLVSQSTGLLPEPLNASSNQLVIERVPPGGQFDLAIRDGTTGFRFL